MALTDSLISHHKLNEASGTRFDSHGSHDLADHNSVGVGTGKLDNAADFENSLNHYLSVQSADFNFNGGSFTGALWFNAESIPAGANYLIGSGDEVGGTPFSFRLWIEPGDFFFEVSDGTTASRARNTDNPAPGTWYFVVFGWDASDGIAFLYVNNGSVAQGVANNGPRNLPTADVYLGWVPNLTPGASDFDGLIDSVSIWSRVLTADERTSLYNAGAGLDYPDFIVLNVPTDFTATSLGPTSISLSWTDNNSSPNETGTEIERSLDGVSGWTLIDTAAADATTFTDTGLDPTTEYFYRIRAVDDVRESEYSDTVNATTEAHLFPGGTTFSPRGPGQARFARVGVGSARIVRKQS